MTAQAPRYSMEEFVERGQFRYEQDIRPLIETDNKGKIVAIDIETGEYEVAETRLPLPTVCMRAYWMHKSGVYVSAIEEFTG